jgi:dipeptidyl aminopeptidase/acylaminoacyl peptidase
MSRWRTDSGVAFAIVLLCLVSGCTTGGGPPATAEPGILVRQQGALILKDVPEISDDIVARLVPYQSTRSAAVMGWLDDDLLIVTRFGQTDQLHRVARPLGVREQLTFFREPVSEAWVPPGEGRGFIYARDVGGSEFYQLFWFDLDNGQERLLTDGHSRYGEVVWANAGDRFAYYTTARNGRSLDIHIQDLEGQVRVALEEDDGAWLPADFSPGDDRLLALLYVSVNESRLYEVDLETGARRPLIDPGLRAAIGQAFYDASGRGVYFTSDMGAEFMRLHYLDLASGAVSVLTSETPWDVERFALSDDGSLLAMSVNEEGLSGLRVWHLPERRLLALPPLPAGVLTGLVFSPDGKRLAASLSTATSPTDVWTVSFGERRISRWTKSEAGGLDESRFVRPEAISYPTFDEVDAAPRRIPAFLYRPRGPGPHPVLIYIHGGPEGQYRPEFSATFQYLVGELGIAVIAPNVRGSTGYGKSYVKLDNGRRREDSVRDIGALLDWIGTRPDLDPERVVVMGGSYGGYMVLASLVHYSERLAAGIESVGISNFVTFLERTQPYRQDLRRQEYGDERDQEMRAFLESISPLNHVNEITRPLMISQGANDPRVPASESGQIFRALKTAGVPVWYVLAGDEGHGFRKKVNRDANVAIMTRFLEAYVLGPSGRRNASVVR